MISDKRQKNQLVLAFTEEGRSEAPKATQEGTESRTAKCETKRPLRSWKSYFGFCQTPSLLKALDEWIRRRLRSMFWKQWKRGKQRYAQLRHLGIGRDLAAQTAGSPHGPGHLANSPALCIALPLAYFDSLGLPRLFDGLA